MKLVNWVRFSWDLTQLPALHLALPDHYQIQAGTVEDEKEVRKVIASSFALDSSWGDAMHEITGMIDGWMTHAFDVPETTCLVLRHGVRIIGATLLAPEHETESHLAPGPCILMEYRNRGLGTILLHEALLRLQRAGLERAVAIAKENVPASKFLYPKFEGAASPSDFTPLLAA